jgi:hypothetical protein
MSAQTVLEAPVTPPTYRIVEARPGHGALVASSMNQHSRSRYRAVSGEDPADGLEFLLRFSPYRRAALINGIPIALWGMTEKDRGLWWQLPDGTPRRNFAIVREAHLEITAMLEEFGFVTLTLPLVATQSHRLARRLGFVVTGQGMCAGQPVVRLKAERKDIG